MSENYWDYWRRTSTCGGTSTSATTDCYCPTDTSSFGWTQSTGSYWKTITRTILVTAPKKWTKKQNMKFVELVNIKTKTGWIVTLVIEGRVLITDPEVEKRTMKDFVPLLKNKASATDLKLINKFFEKNPYEQ